MNFLFYLVHPAKFHFHKVQINSLNKKGHKVDILINSKDILEDLVKEEGWNYFNIFPNGRKIKGLHVYLSAFLTIIKSNYRILKFIKHKKYDLFIGDFLTWVGLIKRVKTLYPTDDVLNQVPEQIIFLSAATHPIAPKITDLKIYNKKTIHYKGYKALAHLHPNHFKPNKNKLLKHLQDGTDYFLIRCTGFFATHDINKKGIDDFMLYKLEKLLSPYGKILITSERKLPKDLKKYNLNIRKSDMSHYIAFAKLFIGDSTTMCTEAAVLGTPAVEFDEYFYEIEQMLELQNKYNLVHCYRTHEQNDMLTKVEELLQTTNLKEIYKRRRGKLLKETIDVSAFLIWIFENYPKSTNEYFSNSNIQDNFKGD
jgi:predicted glycosyltransferase